MSMYRVTLRGGSSFTVSGDSKQDAEKNARTMLRTIAAHERDPKKRKEFVAQTQVMPGRTTQVHRGVDD